MHSGVCMFLNTELADNLDLDYFLSYIDSTFKSYRSFTSFYFPSGYFICRFPNIWSFHFSCALRYTNADLKMSLYVRVHIKMIPWKIRILNPRNSRVMYP